MRVRGAGVETESYEVARNGNGVAIAGCCRHRRSISARLRRAPTEPASGLGPAGHDRLSRRGRAGLFRAQGGDQPASIYREQRPPRAAFGYGVARCATASFEPAIPSHPSPPLSVPSLQTCPPGSVPRVDRPRAADAFVCHEGTSTEIPGLTALRFPPLRGGASVISVDPGEHARALGPCEDGSGCDEIEAHTAQRRVELRIDRKAVNAPFD